MKNLIIVLFASFFIMGCTVDEVLPDNIPPTFTLLFHGELFNSDENYDNCLLIIYPSQTNEYSFTYGYSDTSGIAHSSIEFVGGFDITEHADIPEMERITYNTGGGDPVFKRDRLEFSDFYNDNIFTSGLSTGKVHVIPVTDQFGFNIEIVVRDKQGNASSAIISVQIEQDPLVPNGLKCF